MRVALVLVVALAVAGFTGCGGGDSTSADDEPIRIGAVLSLTGPYAGLGEPERRAIELELERMNADGGVNGRQLEVLFEDDGTDEARAVAAASRLIEQESVIAVIGASGTGQSMAMRQEIERGQVPQISLAGGNVITGQFHPWVFQTPWPNRIVVPFTLERMQEAGVERLALISDSGGYGKDGLDVTMEFVAEYGIEVVAEEQFNRGDTDMTGQLTKIRAAEPDAVLMWAAGAEAATLLKNHESLIGMDVLPVFGAPGNARVELIEGAGSAADGFSFAAGHVLVPDAYGVGSEGYEVATDFIDRFTERYGVAPDIFAGHAYDAFHILVDALRRLPAEFTVEELRDEIESTSGLVAVGGTFTFSPTDHNGMSATDLSFYTVQDGTWVLREEAR